MNMLQLQKHPPPDTQLVKKINKANQTLRCDSGRKSTNPAPGDNVIFHIFYSNLNF